MPERLAAALAGIGPHFTYTVRPAATARGERWRSMTELIDGSSGLEYHYRGVQRTLTTTSNRRVDLRVAASTGHLGLVSRLLCTTIGAAALGYRLDLSDVWWHPADRGSLPLSLADIAAQPTATTTISTGLVAELTRATAGLSVSHRVLEGNIASAVNGAAATICDARPDLAARTMIIARQLLPDAGPDFRRRSCCLYYRTVPIGAPIYCGDCILEPAHRPSPRR